MPLFVYRCRACGKTEEFLQKVQETPTQCPNCGHTGSLEPQLTTAGFSLRGAGWARDGYAGSQPQSLPAKDIEGQLLESARKGGPAGVKKFNRDLAKKYGNR